MASAQVGIVGSPEWQAYKNAELAHLAPSIGPSAAQGINHANELLAWEQANLVHTANALNFVASGAGRRKRQVQVMISFLFGFMQKFTWVAIKICLCIKPVFSFLGICSFVNGHHNKYSYTDF